jgi:polyisoprenoid-binding protein YceI
MFAKYLTIILLVVSFGSSSHASDWTIDPVHSSIGFAVKHMVVSTVRGSFGVYESKISFDPAKPTSIIAEIEIDAKSIDTGVKKRDNHLRNADFFDVEKFPKLKFKARKIESLGGSHYKVIGDLTIKDVTREIALDGDGFGGLYKNPWGKSVTAVSARATINREDFGLVWNVPLENGAFLVSKNVDLEIELELVKVE